MVRDSSGLSSFPNLFSFILTYKLETNCHIWFRINWRSTELNEWRGKEKLGLSVGWNKMNRRTRDENVIRRRMPQGRFQKQKLHARTTWSLVANFCAHIKRMCILFVCTQFMRKKWATATYTADHYEQVIIIYSWTQHIYKRFLKRSMYKAPPMNAKLRGPVFTSIHPHVSSPKLWNKCRWRGMGLY
jgi:hypothetical protein